MEHISPVVPTDEHLSSPQFQVDTDTDPRAFRVWKSGLTFTTLGRSIGALKTLHECGSSRCKFQASGQSKIVSLPQFAQQVEVLFSLLSCLFLFLALFPRNKNICPNLKH